MVQGTLLAHVPIDGRRRVIAAKEHVGQDNDIGLGNENPLICDIDIHQLWTDIIVVWIDDVDLIDEVTFFIPKDAAWIGKIEGAIFMIQIP